MFHLNFIVLFPRLFHSFFLLSSPLTSCYFLAILFPSLVMIMTEGNEVKEQQVDNFHQKETQVLYLIQRNV
jgi:hypothetical protein